MSYYGNSDWLIEVAKGNIPGHSLIHKFGKNAAIGTSYVPVSFGGVYRTPQVAGATTLRVKAGGDANDTAAGTGAREITFEGLDETGAFATEAVATAGALVSLATTVTFMRMFRFYVSASGTYADQISPSHADDIVVEDGAGTEDWGTIENTSFGRSQSVVAVYTVPLGKTGYLMNSLINVDSNKAAEVLEFRRENILETAAPYTAMRLQHEWLGLLGGIEISHPAPHGIPALTDIGYMAKVTLGTGGVSIDFELLLVDDGF